MTCDADEVRVAFARYEHALVNGDLAVLTASFWDSAQTSRFGVSDQQTGAAELAAWRAAQPPLPAGRRLFDTRVLAFPDAAVVSTLFDYPDVPVLGRQSQVWIRRPEGWRIVHAHVSHVAAPSS